MTEHTAVALRIESDITKRLQGRLILRLWRPGQVSDVISIEMIGPITREMLDMFDQELARVREILAAEDGND